MDEVAVEQLLTGPDARQVLAEAGVGETVRSWRVRAVHRRVGRSLSVVFELDVEGAARTVVAHVDRQPVPAGSQVVDTAGAAVHLWWFPHDPFLPALPAAVSPTAARRLLDPAGGPPGPVTTTVRAYRPSRRAVVEVAVDGCPAAFHKVVLRARAERLVAVHRQLAPTLPVPRILGSDVTLGSVTLAPLPGVSLRRALVEGASLPPPGELVELSRRLAAVELPDDGGPQRFADPSRHVAALRHLLPDAAGELERVAGVAQAASGPRGGVHGDLHDGQVRVDVGTVVGLLDVDGAGRGLLAHDAGSLVAHVEAVALVWPRAAGKAEAYAAELAHAYQRLVEPPDLAAAAAGAWLGLATGPHRAQDPGWQERTRRRIARAAAWADRAG